MVTSARPASDGRLTAMIQTDLPTACDASRPRHLVCMSWRATPQTCWRLPMFCFFEPSACIQMHGHAVTSRYPRPISRSCNAAATGTQLGVPQNCCELVVGQAGHSGDLAEGDALISSGAARHGAHVPPGSRSGLWPGRLSYVAAPIAGPRTHAVRLSCSGSGRRLRNAHKPADWLAVRGRCRGAVRSAEQSLD